MAYRGELIGEHPSIEQTRALISKIARSPASSVLIYGETGTGKGVVARMLHQQSSRSAQEFVDINCAAIPSDLLESELFGHEKGAFTGAVTRKNGLVETADGGTLFMDEIRDLDLVRQAKLLSFLDTQEYRRVGSVTPIHVDVRFIAATNRILYREVLDGRFRDDLYFRLQVVSLNIPPLRERGDDCLVLTEYFLRKFNTRYDRSISGWEPAVADIFRAYHWPGNVRELENLLERIFILEEDNKILVRHIPDRILREVDRPQARKAVATGQVQGFDYDGLSFHDATEQLHRTMIESALARNRHNITDTAAALGLSRHSLRHHMLKLGLQSTSDAEDSA
ncbi:sigma-54 interaction domain-containing protein [Marinobacterium aestuariivivens]|uniref:Sigma-54 interaction domain-containing protein n=1 Tax=Marinobacterium aestuariivivens TaxID=1698799 RepID=A0ABW2A3F4_9GAMM